jgi:paraquat-inducible protein A
VSALWGQERYAVAGLACLTTMIAPAGQIVLLLYVLAPIHFDWPGRGAIPVFPWVERFREWSMMEVFLIGILVALVKLSDMAEIVPGLALWAFALLIPVLAGALPFSMQRSSGAGWRLQNDGLIEAVSFMACGHWPSSSSSRALWCRS